MSHESRGWLLIVSLARRNVEPHANYGVEPIAMENQLCRKAYVIPYSLLEFGVVVRDRLSLFMDRARALHRAIGFRHCASNLNITGPTSVGYCFGLGRWKRQQRNIRKWLSVSLRSTPTPAGEEFDGSPVIGPIKENLQEDEDAFVGLNSSLNYIASLKNERSQSGGRMADRAPSYENPRYGKEASTKVGNRGGMAESRLRLKWGVDLDIQVTIVWGGEWCGVSFTVV